MHNTGNRYGNRFSRLWRHWFCDASDVRKAFGPEGFARVERAIAQGERRHSAEVRFAVEASLDAYRVFAEVSPRQRAQHHFSSLGVWDTEGNNGVLIYLLLADKAVELIVDREASRRISHAVWEQACAQMSAAFARGQFAEGVIAGLDCIHPELERAFPAIKGDVDELPNQVVLI